MYKQGKRATGGGGGGGKKIKKITEMQTFLHKSALFSSYLKLDDSTLHLLLGSSSKSSLCVCARNILKDVPVKLSNKHTSREETSQSTGSHAATNTSKASCPQATSSQTSSSEATGP